jgi:hypothetical protein
MLAAVNLDDQLLFQANKIQNVILKGKLSAELHFREAAISEQMPHNGFGIGTRRAAYPAHACVVALQRVDDVRRQA